jgi:hypothetical protein
MTGFRTFSIALISIISFTAGFAETETTTLSPASAKPAPTMQILIQRATVGQDCTGSEGMWNCMSNSFQRCASGRWSEVMQCAAGTQCSPSGTGYQFNIGFSGAGTTAYTSGTTSKAPILGARLVEYICTVVLFLLVGI